jgi:hypothetical protein
MGTTTEAHAQPHNNNEQSNGQGAISSPNDRRAKVEQLFGQVSWEDETTGFITCPGQEKHTGKNGPQDCQIKIDNVPTVHCLHQSCAEEIKSANKKLRDSVKSSNSVELTKEQKKLAAAKAKFEKELEIRTKKSLPTLLKNYAWPYDKIVADSPQPIQPDDRQAMFHAFTGMFEDEDVVWIGEVGASGQPHHAFNFNTKAEWLAGEIPTGPYTCPSCFVPGSFSRTKDNVARQRYLVVESDSLSKDQVGAIFKWLVEAVGLPLCAVVDTAGKSLHGWFEYPPADVLAELKIMLPAMGSDPKMFGASQPCRLPGGLRDGRIQRLIYAAKGGAK